jgi:hypothetical protein
MKYTMYCSIVSNTFSRPVTLKPHVLNQVAVQHWLVEVPVLHCFLFSDFIFPQELSTVLMGANVLGSNTKIVKIVAYNVDYGSTKCHDPILF